MGWILAALLAPVHQFPQNVVVELSCQTGKRPVTFGLRPVAGRAGGNVSTGNALLIDFFARDDGFLLRTAEGLGIEIFEMRGESRDHVRAEHMRNIVQNTLEYEISLAKIFVLCQMISI